MLVGMLTSWNTQCGIAEYSRYLTSAMREIDDVDVVVLGSKNYDERKVAEDESFVVPVFGVLPWNNYGDHSFDTEEILELDLDVLHIQYEVVLYNPLGLLDLLTRFKGPKVVTYHDNCIPRDFPYSMFNLRYTHREEVGVGERYLIPFGIEDRAPVVKTFGLGRSRADIIEQVCSANGWRVDKSFGEQDWKSTDELTNWLRDSDAIVLYYDDVPSAGSSQAARTAIGTRRPVIVNDVTWFRGVEGVYKVETPQELEETLRHLFKNTVIERDSWGNLAVSIVEDYKECLRILSNV